MASSETLSGSLAADGSSDVRGVTRKRYNMSVWGTFDATVTLQRKFPGESDWLSCKQVTAAYEGVGIETEAKVEYRFTVSNYVSGTINFRLGLTTL